MNTDVPGVVPIDLKHKQATRRRKAMGLTESERQQLLNEVADIAAELSEMQRRAAEIAGRVAESSRDRANRSA